jgi:predicted XRE-type DNA-binding protein
MTKSAFHELELADADELVVKSRLMCFLGEEIRKRRLTQKGAAELLGLDQPNVSALVNEKVSRFSIKKLMTLAGRLGFAVTIHMVSAVLALSCLTLATRALADVVKEPEVVEPRPLIALVEWDPWAQLFGADLPTFALYEDGLAIFRNAPRVSNEDMNDQSKWSQARLTNDERDRIVAEVEAEVRDLDERYTLEQVTDQFTEALYLWSNGNLRIISVYGNLRGPSRLKAPREFLQVFDRFASFRDSRAEPWNPDRIELLLKEADDIAAEPVAWPEEWPSMSELDVWQRRNGYSVFVSLSGPLTRDMLFKFLGDAGKQKRPVLLSGRKWIVWSYRLPFPNDWLWLTRNTGRS